MTGKKIGDIGEDKACEYLVEKGYFIERRNYRYNFCEIDIIAVDTNGCVVFIEVKTRKNTDYGYPSEFVDKRKMERLRDAARLYCAEEDDIRFDIIEVFCEYDGGEIKIKGINHIENAF